MTGRAETSGQVDNRISCNQTSRDTRSTLVAKNNEIQTDRGN